MNRNDKKGFTLVELLCVLIILALLAVLIGRTVTKSVKEAKKEITASQEKSILNAAEKWAVDNSNLFDDQDEQRFLVGLDVVFVIDASGSMQENMSKGGGTRSNATITAINNALSVLKPNKHSRVGFVFYNSSIAYSMGLKSIENISSLSVNGSSMKVEGHSISLSGDTYTQAGIQEAYEILNSESDKEDHIPVIILLTDGEPTYGRNLAFDESDWMKVRSADIKYGASEDPFATSSPNGTTLQVKLEGFARMAYYTARVGYRTKAALKGSYNSDVYFYTIGIDVTSQYGKFVLNPTRESYNQLVSGGGKMDNCSQQNVFHGNSNRDLYNKNKASCTHYLIENYTQFNKPPIQVGDYDYATESYLGNMSAEELRSIFLNISEVLIEATKITESCVSVETLAKGGYLSIEKLGMTEEERKNNYVLLYENVATNQWQFSMANTDQQKQLCDKLLNN